MNLEEAVRSFDEWEFPWKFGEKVKEALAESDSSLKKFEAISNLAGERENWFQGDLVIGCKITQNRLNEMFPDVPEDVLACFVRSASYDWR
ncbi:hypothetical protein [Coraliomargarita akajimensis]|uniref:Uncharacterized protein n=1 Tax=Coraliomargarita akajimensis (strain DSM 45221 / IAM 15411 / JCM 23193 / KCTC 12865 / 04OKA010-24) TaxID=583355 RepID=D5EMB8_CORAD|nr:hypothetical protein [Coraliomargarita akajimensis]ADE53324.1 hypothetical protein Caka_0298 [Coraliomargarita akajimensis DSM 45221]